MTLNAINYTYLDSYKIGRESVYTDLTPVDIGTPTQGLQDSLKISSHKTMNYSKGDNFNLWLVALTFASIIQNKISVDQWVSINQKQNKLPDTKMITGIFPT